jgi:RNA polymerase sigma-70 factor (ECF subfamily)
MSIGTLGRVVQQIRSVVSRPVAADSTDHQLLNRFLDFREEDAFAALVRRHGSMVMGVCLRLLNHRQDAEDAFQATFLMLVRKGNTIRQGDALAGWLYRVAFRIALRARQLKQDSSH